MDPIGRVVFLPSVIFDFDCYPVGTSLTFSALFVVAVVAADVVVVGVFFPCAVTLVPVAMVVVVMVLGLFFWLTVDIVLSLPPLDFFYGSKKGVVSYYALFGIVSFWLKMCVLVGGGGELAYHIFFLTKIICRMGILINLQILKYVFYCFLFCWCTIYRTLSNRIFKIDFCQG